MSSEADIIHALQWGCFRALRKLLNDADGTVLLSG